MPKETDATTFKIQISRLTLANKRLAVKVAARDEELKFAKTALVKIRAGYEARIINTLKLDIQDVLGCTDHDLMKLTEGATIPELEQMFVNFSTAIDSKKSPYDKTKTKTASIRPGGAGPMVPGGRRLIVGSTFGKTAEEIAEMGGDF